MLASSHIDTAAYAGKLLSARFNGARGKLKVNLTHTHTHSHAYTQSIFSISTIEAHFGHIEANISV